MSHFYAGGREGNFPEAHKNQVLPTESFRLSGSENREVFIKQMWFYHLPLQARIKLMPTIK